MTESEESLMNSSKTSYGMVQVGDMVTTEVTSDNSIPSARASEGSSTVFTVCRVYRVGGEHTSGSMDLMDLKELYTVPIILIVSQSGILNYAKRLDTGQLNGHWFDS